MIEVDPLRAILMRHCASLDAEITEIGDKLAYHQPLDTLAAEALREAIELTHRMKGSSGTLGFSGLGEAAARLEDAVKMMLEGGASVEYAELSQVHELLGELARIAAETRPEDSTLYNVNLQQFGAGRRRLWS